jgi:hypothetical protein
MTSGHRLRVEGTRRPAHLQTIRLVISGHLLPPRTAAEVVVQAAAMVYAIAGLGIWVDRDGGVLDKAAFESGESLFPEMVGLMVHGMNGMMVIPLLALLFLIFSFFAKVPGGVRWAAAVFVAVVVQVALGLFGAGSGSPASCRTSTPSWTWATWSSAAARSRAAAASTRRVRGTGTARQQQRPTSPRWSAARTGTPTCGWS